MHYNPATKIFSLTWSRRAGVVGASQIYIPKKRHYPTGFRVSVNGQPVDLEGAWDARRELLSVALPSAGDRFQLEVRPE
jgi:hypothetical protein